MKFIPLVAAALVTFGAVSADAAMADWHNLIGTWADTTDGNCRITMSNDGSVVSNHCSRWNFARFSRPYPDDTDFVARDGTLCHVTLIIPLGNRTMVQTPCGSFTLTRVQ